MLMDFSGIRNILNRVIYLPKGKIMYLEARGDGQFVLFTGCSNSRNELCMRIGFI